jgi:ABC-2 type transport system ATP-binding protein
MIEIRDLTKSYGNTTAIRNLNFSVSKGEVVGFLGPNGAGKTTTMKIITGYMAPTTGSVKVAGFDVFESPIEVKKRIGYLPETPPVHPDMYVRDYLAFVAKLKGVPKSKIRSMVDMALEKAGLTDRQKRLIQHLSKGYKQRVGIAQALVSEPELLILDEPTVGLDPKQVAEIRRLIQSLQGHHTIVLSTHILPEVQATCQRIIIINQGTIVAEDTLAGLNERMHGARRVLLKVRRLSDNLLTQLRAIDGVRHIEASSDRKSIQVDMEAREEIPEAVANQVVTSGAGLIEMRSLDMSLEDIFLKLTSEDKSEGATA